MKTQKGNKSFKIRFIVYSILGLLTLIPFMGVSKANMLAYYSLCTFTPISTIICFGLATMFIIKYRKSINTAEPVAVKKGKMGPKAISIMLVLLLAVGFTTLTLASKQAEQYYISNNAKVTSFEPGIYTGEYRFAKVISLAKVEIKVSEEKIEFVDFIRLANTPTHKCKDEVIQRVISRQQIDFDAVTGATRSSNFAKAALVNAFLNK